MDVAKNLFQHDYSNSLNRHMKTWNNVFKNQNYFYLNLMITHKYSKIMNKFKIFKKKIKLIAHIIYYIAT